MHASLKLLIAELHHGIERQAFQPLALESVGGVAETRMDEVELNPAALRDGTNVVAVEVHCRYPLPLAAWYFDELSLAPA